MEGLELVWGGSSCWFSASILWFLMTAYTVSEQTPVRVIVAWFYESVVICWGWDRRIGRLRT